jgi:hypothetical protein
MLARLAGAVPVFALRRPRRYEAAGEAAEIVRRALAAREGAGGETA